MLSGHKKDCELSREKARFIHFLKRWRAELVTDEILGAVGQIEFDRRILDYYLDEYNKLATFPSRFPVKAEPAAVQRTLGYDPEPGMRRLFAP